MPQLDETKTKIASVYGRALFDLARERGQEDEIAEQLGELDRYVDREPEFAAFLSADLNDDHRAESLERMFRGKLSDTLLDTLLVLNGRGRLSILGALAEQFEHLRHEARNQAEASVISAIPLESKERDALVGVLKAATGREIVLTEKVDKAILGGLIVQIGDELLDASVASQLKRMRNNLRARAAREVHGDKEYFVSA